MKKLLSFLLSLVFVCVVFAVSVFADGGNSSTGFLGIIGWFKANWESVLAIIGGIVSVATVIVKLTPTPKDDNVLATLIRLLSVFSLVNPDGSFIGRKDDWILKVAKWGFVYIKAKQKGYIPQIEITDKLYMPISKEVVKGKFIKFTWRFWKWMKKS